MGFSTLILVGKGPAEAGQPDRGDLTASTACKGVEIYNEAVVQSEFMPLISKILDRASIRAVVGRAKC
jgi:hypothetical protein